MNSPRSYSPELRCRGAAAVELLVFIPFLLLLLIGSADLARGMQIVVALDNAVRVGLTTAAHLLNEKDNTYKPIYYDRTSDGDIVIKSTLFTAVRDSVVGAGQPYLTPANVNPFPPPTSCRCPVYDSACTIAKPDPDCGKWVACAGPTVIKNCTAPEILMQVTVTTQMTYSFGGYFGLPKTLPVSRNAFMTVR